MTEDNPLPTPKGPLTFLWRLVRQRSAATESASKYDGAFSYADEYHAAAIAFAAGYAGGPNAHQQIITYALGLGGGKAGLSDDPHVKDLADEPAYALGALAVGKMAKHGELALTAL